MTIASEVEQIQAAGDKDFAEQLRQMRELRERQGATCGPEAPVVIGVDRSRELNPVVRPSLVRAISATLLQGGRERRRSWP